MATATKAKVVKTDVETNGHANSVLAMPEQVIVAVTLEGTAAMLFHRYDCSSVAQKGAAAKGSAAKKTDDIESYTYRDADGNLAVPADALQGCLTASARSFQDPRSPRKSAVDLVKAGILVLPDMLTLRNSAGEVYPTWDFTDTRRVCVQRAAVSRVRPGVEAGWTLNADIHILLPDHISVELLRRMLVNGGAVCGLCDFRPRFGRFQVTRAEVVSLG